MQQKLLRLLNVKPHESTVVRKLFTIQFFLGVATAFLFTSSLTMFLSSYEIKSLPIAYILSACLLFVFNRIYSYLDEKYAAPKVLKIVILFSAASILFFWLLLMFVPFKQLPMIIAGWYMLIYMLVGYAFWGMAAMLFNVRESKRLFSIVGSGDIPAKMLGYSSVTALYPIIGVNNLLWVSIISFSIAWFLLNKFQNQGLMAEEPAGAANHHHHEPTHSSGLINELIKNRLVSFIALLSLVSYIVFAFIDFTFLSDIKLKFKHGNEIATFVAVFFAAGRILAVFIKILFSSRMISRIGLSNSLLVTPVLLLLIDAFIIATGNRFVSDLYIFGFMVLLTEILRSTLQEPVFFILFQPLKPHDRLRGHLVAKGFTMPFALMGVGVFLVFYLKEYNELTIIQVADMLVALILVWVGTVFIIKKEYLQTLIVSLKKGYFTGAELFLNSADVTKILINKTDSHKPLEVIHSLNLLERSGYADIYKLLLKKYNRPENEIKEYILSRIIANNMTSALPLIKQEMQANDDSFLKPKLIKAFFYLNNESTSSEQIAAIETLNFDSQKAAMEGLLNRHEEATEQKVIERLTTLASGKTEEKLLATEVIMNCECENYTAVLRILLADLNPLVYKKAIEAAGKVKNNVVFDRVVETSVSRHAYPSFKIALTNYGDEIFSHEILKNAIFPSEMLRLVIKAAGTIKGENSTRFLIDLLNKKSTFSNEIIESLWLKKTKISPEANAVVTEFVNEKTENSRHKIMYYGQSVNNKTLTLLQEAIFKEVSKDVTVLLKAYALLYDREKIDRVIELLNVGNTSKISNAIEVLDLIIPKKHFTQLNQMVEFVYDVQHHELLSDKNILQPATVIEDVLTDIKANFGSWTKSVALYTLPKLKKHEFSINLSDKKLFKDDRLLNETRNYVLSMLK